ncbi:hypothetical protein [Corynebacterium casei]|uniref:hypothetical protein n=1 Tax=Corynebacterium casei TaxID=160386 RepID=UPI0026490FA5|nr:hypothetical protein [Corynebacterium casei]MDN5884052.1 hypothetical protein [Corynebacterium casei]MDN5901840.1 hypothetical protein [Corynebacterium casei]MDN6444075.1 hypothetical protein [Corynebacterium casei]MDN6627321.1 hypothetical protein [Corynebacterium casei]MDN6672707.1 hypothetical protein [Corynebacterium casei]
MNPIAAQQALKVASSLWGQFNKYRKEKAAEAYSALEDAASTVKDNANSFSDDVESRFPEARKQAGAVTKAAHDRVERALAEFNSRGEEASERLVSAASDFSDRAEKATRSTRKKTRKQAAQATKAAQAKRKQLEKTANKKLDRKLGKKKSKSKAKSFFSIAGIIALIAAALGGVYYWLRRNDTPGEVPPRVEDFADKPGTPDTSGSTLVYTSTTEDDQKDKAGVKVGSAGDLAEDGAEERDEELLNSLEEQLAAHREQAEQAETDAASNTNDVDATEPVADSDAPEADAEADKAQETSDDAANTTDADDTARVTDDSEDEGKHRLEGDEK